MRETHGGSAEDDSGHARRLCPTVQAAICLIPCMTSNTGCGEQPWGLLFATTTTLYGMPTCGRSVAPTYLNLRGVCANEKKVGSLEG
jgi:hypothetical protein